MANTSYDVVIIGAGTSGSIVAYELAKYDLKVCVLEAGIDVASGSTRANSAIVHAGYDAKEGTLKAKLNVRGCELMKGLTAKLGVSYKKCGSLVIGYSEADREHLELLKARGEKNGVPDLEIIDGENLHKMEPCVSKDAICALYAPSAGIVCPYDLAYALCENAATNGTQFHFESKVNKIKKKGELYTVYTENGIKVQARFVINAAGLFVDEIAGLLNEKLPFDIIPRRGEYMLLDKTEIKTASHTLFVTPSEKGKGILISPTVDGNIIVGPNANIVDSKVDTSVTEAGLEEIAEGALHIVPSINLDATITTFAGVRATPTSGDFYIQESDKFKKFIHVAGIESPGLASAPAIGEYVIEILKECGLSLEERKDYIPTRTKNGNFVPFYAMTEEQRREAVTTNPSYAKVICRCEMVTEADVLDALHRPIPARTVDMVKRRTRGGMGRCQGNYCRAKIAEMIAKEHNIPLSEVKKFSSNSHLLFGKTK